MMERVPYEISLWHDKSSEDNKGFKEVKDVILATHDINFAGAAYSPVLTLNINGTKSLTFNLPIKYRDKDGELVRNFIFDRLHSEDKIKLRRANQWYTFIVKDIQESRNQMIASISCTDLTSNDLSKKGFELIFSLDLGNNTGTIDELAQKILLNSGWHYTPTNFPLVEYKEEVLYRVTHLINLSGQLIKPTIVTPENTVSRNLVVSEVDGFPKGDLFVFYSDKLIEGAPIQAIFIPIGEELVFDGDTNLVVNLNNTIELDRGLIDWANSTLVSPNIGRKLIKSAEFKYSEELNRYLQRYNRIDNDFEDIYYGYEETYWEQDLDEGSSTYQEYIYKIKQVNVKFKEDNVNLVRYIYESEIPPAALEAGLVVGDIRDYFYEGTFELYNNNYTKTRILEEEKSNRFNLLQTLCELFEVWLDYEIEYEEDGRFVLDSEGNVIRRIFFRQSNVQINNVGFKYAVNLAGIERSIDSAQLTTKLFVEKNDSDVAESGICSIQTAYENIAKEIFLINLDWYVRTGLLSQEELYNDLYLGQDVDLLIGAEEVNFDYSKGIGYLVNLGELNYRLDNLLVKTYAIEDDLSIETERNLDLQASLQIKIAQEETIIELINNNEYIANNLDGLLIELDVVHATIEEIQAQVSESNIRLEELTTYIDINYEIVDRINEIKQIINQVFNNKYNRFIQEGSWGDSSYLVADQYYTDAIKVLYASSMPNTSYTINVVDLEAAAGYELFTFKTGDVTFIEDEEFFGFTKSGMPYRQKVVVSEIQYALDDPSHNKIVIQNYSTQFEDLFQRISASTQTLEFNKNIYSRAGNFNDSGEIDPTIVEKTLQNNQMILAEAPDQSIVIDQTGITLRDANGLNSEGKGSKVVKLVSTGIVLGNEITDEWTTGISADGINTQLLTAGQLDVSKINLYINGIKTFGLDSRGLTAFGYNNNGPNPDGSVDVGEVDSDFFVRLDQYGLYFNRSPGFQIPPNSSMSQAITYVRKTSALSLTWAGFLMKTQSGAVSISSENDIQVFDGEQERIRLGLLSVNTYGLRLTDKNGVLRLQADDVNGVSLVNSSITLTNGLGQIIINPEVGIELIYNGQSKGQLSIVDGSVSVGVDLGGWESANDSLQRSPTGTSGNWARLGGPTYAFSSGTNQTPGVEPPFWVDYAGNLKATKATITGIIHATGGSFTGNINAQGATFQNLTAVNGNFSGRITATTGNIAGFEITSNGFNSNGLQILANGRIIFPGLLEIYGSGSSVQIYGLASRLNLQGQSSVTIQGGSNYIEVTSSGVSIQNIPTTTSTSYNQLVTSGGRIYQRSSGGGGSTGTFTTVNTNNLYSNTGSEIYVGSYLRFSSMSAGDSTDGTVGWGSSSGRLTIRGRSSKRYKKDIEPMRDCFIEGLSKMNAVEFNYKDIDPKKYKEIGFIAEEVAEACPELVNFKELNGEIVPDGFKYTEFPVALFHYVKYLESQIKELKESIL